MMTAFHSIRNQPMKKLVGRSVAVVLLGGALGAVYMIGAHKAWFTKSAPQARVNSASAQPHRVLYWYDPMHPAYQSNKPGIAPDCGMELVPKYADEGAKDAAANNIALTAAQQRFAGVATTVAQRTQLMREITTSAVIVPDETRISHIHVKIPGFAENVFANITGSQIHKGEKLFTYYSPDLVAAEQEYLIARRGGTTLGNSAYSEVRDAATSLLASARQRLKLLDMNEEQIAHLEKSGEASREIAFYSPVAGFITDRKIFPQSSIAPDQDLYTLSDLSTVWAIVDVNEADLPYVHPGQRVTLNFNYDPGKAISGAIAYIYPSLDPQTRTAKLRVQLANPGYKLKPQMFANAVIHIDYGRPLSVPREAVLDSGMSQRVYVVRDGGNFEARKVTVGPTVGENAIILSGLSEGESVVRAGNFLIDADSRLKNPTGGER